jgi:single-strand DNA-binding protein
MLNRVILIGRVARVPELRYTPSGKAVANFVLAVDRRQRSGNGEKEADFIPIVAWQRLGEICNEFLTTGKLIAIEGSLRTRTYEVDGQKRKAFEVWADEMRMLSRPDDSGSREKAPAPASRRTGESYGGTSDFDMPDDDGGVGMDEVPF